MTRPVNSPRQMALKQTLQRNVFRKPVDQAPKAPPPERSPEPPPAEQASTEPIKAAPVATGPKVGRNDPCFCGSGKKFKKCCG